MKPARYITRIGYDIFVVDSRHRYSQEYKSKLKHIYYIRIFKI